ncbi:hypothetical protein HanRHA438_Chr07g0300171 [Helianthus annuus]|nr:hypothetical protein HanRHA438_Chr07g0300171 [Helianthus annuus]
MTPMKKYEPERVGTSTMMNTNMATPHLLRLILDLQTRREKNVGNVETAGRGRNPLFPATKVLPYISCPNKEVETSLYRRYGKTLTSMGQAQLGVVSTSPQPSVVYKLQCARLRGLVRNNNI